MLCMCVDYTHLAVAFISCAVIKWGMFSLFSLTHLLGAARSELNVHASRSLYARKKWAGRQLERIWFIYLKIGREGIQMMYSFPIRSNSKYLQYTKCIKFDGVRTFKWPIGYEKEEAAALWERERKRKFCKFERFSYLFVSMIISLFFRHMCLLNDIC